MPRNKPITLNTNYRSIFLSLSFFFLFRICLFAVTIIFIRISIVIIFKRIYNQDDLHKRPRFRIQNSLNLLYLEDRLMAPPFR